MCVQANKDEMGGVYAAFLPTKNNINSSPQAKLWTQAVWCLSGHETILNTPFMCMKTCIIRVWPAEALTQHTHTHRVR